MSQPEHQAIVNEIRGAQIPASPELRERVRAIASRVPPEPPRREPWFRGPRFLVPAGGLAVAGTLALAIGLATSGSGSREEHVVAGQASRAAPPPPPVAFTDEEKAAQDATTLQRAAGGAAGNLPTTPGRAQLYQSELTLKVANLSNTTKSALRLTRTYHGYVRSVEYGSGTERGSAYIVLRVPIGSVQEAIVKFSALGEILEQHVSIQDVQPTVDKRFRQMQAIRDQVAKLQARLTNPALTDEARKALEDELVAQRRQLVVLQKQQAVLARQTSFATVELELRTADKAVVVPHDPGRIERALDRAASILLDEVKVALYALIVGAPLLALGFLVFGGAKVRRRRTEERLLSTS